MSAAPECKPVAPNEIVARVTVGTDCFYATRTYPRWHVIDDDRVMDYAYGIGTRHAQDDVLPVPPSHVPDELAGYDGEVLWWIEPDTNRPSQDAISLVRQAMMACQVRGWFPDVQCRQYVDGKWLRLTRFYVGAYTFQVAPSDTVRLEFDVSARSVDYGWDSVVVGRRLEVPTRVLLDPRTEWTNATVSFELRNVYKVENGKFLVEWPWHHGKVIVQSGIQCSGPFGESMKAEIIVNSASESDITMAYPGSPGYRRRVGENPSMEETYPGYGVIPDWARDRFIEWGDWGETQEKRRLTILSARNRVP